MNLMTKELEERFQQMDKKGNSVVIAHFFHVGLGWNWYATEYDPDDKIFFGFVNGFELEWGSFALEELEESNVMRDTEWKECNSYDLFKTLEKLKL